MSADPPFGPSGDDETELFFEGGSIRAEDRGGKFLLHINQVALLDLLDPDDRDGIAGIETLSFASRSERTAYMRERGWLRARQRAPR